jgi:hypothetical protein
MNKYAADLLLLIIKASNKAQHNAGRRCGVEMGRWDG